MPYDLDRIKEEISVNLKDPKHKGPKHWLGAEIPYLIYEGLVEYAKDNKVTLGQLMLHAFGCFFSLKDAAKAGETFTTTKTTERVEPPAPAPAQHKKKPTRKTLAQIRANTVPPTATELSELTEIR